MNRIDMAFASDDRWLAVQTRQASADGSFVYAVTTTGIYCRPSCPSRRPKPGHVRFFATSAEARQAGFRPCRRCTPDDQAQQDRIRELVVQACRMIDTADSPPTLDQLAQRLGVSPFHFHRQFKTIIGMTPKAYASAKQAEKMRVALDANPTVTASIYDAGYGSASRFYEKADTVLGMTAQQFRAKGNGTTISFAVGQSSLGAVLVARTERGVCAILLGDDPQALVHDLQDRFPKAQLVGGDAGFERDVAKVISLIEHPSGMFDLPLDVQGTVFQQKVWNALRCIPAGKTASYRQIAQAIGEPKAMRAVAQACGANKIAVAIPCHRVVRLDGSLSGYRWGVNRKRELLRRESRD